MRARPVRLHWQRCVGAVAFVWITTAAVVARADTAGAFDAAMKAMIAGDLEAAQRGFEEVAQSGDAAWADDGLREAGRIAELRGRYAEAQAHYRALIARFPGSPYVRHAHARLGYLERIVGADAAFADAQAQRERIMQQAAALEDPAPALMALEALLRQHPQLPAWPDAAQWLGEQWLLQGDVARGLGWFRTLADRPGADRGTRQRALAAALLRVGKLEEASSVMAALAANGDASERAALAELRRKLAAAERQRIYRWLAVAWLAAFFVAAALRLRYAVHTAAQASNEQGMSATWRYWRAYFAPDIFVVYMVPVGVGLAAMSYSRQPMVAAATLWIVCGAVLLTWLLRGVLRTRPPRAMALGFVIGAICAALALIYVAVTQDRLIDMLIETWQYGHDRA